MCHVHTGGDTMCHVHTGGDTMCHVHTGMIQCVMCIHG